MDNKKTQRKIKSIFYIFLGFLIAMGGATATNKKLYYKSHGTKTYATIITKYKNIFLDDPTLKSGKNSITKNYFFKLRFFDHTDLEYVVDTPVFIKTWDKYTADMPIEILYNPREPGKNVIVTQDRRAVSISLEIFFTILGLLMFYFGITIFDKKEWFWVKDKNNKETGIGEQGP